MLMGGVTYFFLLAPTQMSIDPASLPLCNDNNGEQKMILLQLKVRFYLFVRIFSLKISNSTTNKEIRLLESSVRGHHYNHRRRETPFLLFITYKNIYFKNNHIYILMGYRVLYHHIYVPFVLHFSSINNLSTYLLN
jgi:hypothetical protein